MTPTKWTLEFSFSALKDYQDILAWTLDRFGAQQARVYARAIESAFQELHQGPDAVCLRWRPELGVRVASLHVARNGYKGRHMIIFSLSALEDEAVIRVLRLLHDSMDLQRHQLFTDAE
ncbi:type II toxin-antitoxin system RelE/ParE family toxin [Cellvibrio sp. OA-2007]|uniref:type II toxin-antitoxin system RelE/ParE family toxin n=1 Tax=Cellvibrio sp. OA-2007 TaxID=529823 RepID=UPI0007833189|nr:type II toxin-antitoxin system RelE/ParE family toxin [Cellvibrio sp. OA-2007]